MSSTPKKKTQTKTVEPKARYKNGDKVFIISYAFAGPGQIFEGEITRADTIKHPIRSENGKLTGNETFFTYIVHTSKGPFEINQFEVYPSFFEAAKVFAKAFLFLLK